MTHFGKVREMLAEYNQAAKSDERFQSALPHLVDDTTFAPNYGPLANLGRAVSQLNSAPNRLAWTTSGGSRHSKTWLDTALPLAVGKTATLNFARHRSEKTKSSSGVLHKGKVKKLQKRRHIFFCDFRRKKHWSKSSSSRRKK